MYIWLKGESSTFYSLKVMDVKNQSVCLSRKCVFGINRTQHKNTIRKQSSGFN